jgi:putative membrane protein
MKHLLWIAVFAVGILVAIPIAGAAEKKEIITSDADFLAKSMTCGTAAVKYSEIAAKQAANDDVKAFAKRMVKDHAQMNDKLAVAAKNLKIAVVSGLEKDMKARCENLAKLTGADFDRAYLKIIIEEHERGIKNCESEARTSTDPDLKAFAASAVPDLKKHVQEARDLSEKIK